MGSSTRRIRIQAPAGFDALQVAQAVVGPEVLLKARPRAKWADRPFKRLKPLKGLYGSAQRLYRAQLKGMNAAIRAFVEAKVVGGTLVKAGVRPLPVMTPEQLQEIAAIIRDYHTGFMVGVGVTEGVSPDEIQDLVARGILPKETIDLIGDSFTYGQLNASIRDMGDQQKLHNSTYDDYKAQVAKTPVPITANERRAQEWARHSAAVHIRGMGNKVADDVSTITIAADAEIRRKYMGQVRESLDQGIEERKTWRKIANDIQERTDDWERDMMRVAATETQTAYQEGFVEGLVKREGDPDTTLVAKLPAPDACKHCIRLHLTGGYGTPPRVFKLSELVDNGTNVGRKAAEWQAVVGATHPWCFRATTRVELEDGTWLPIAQIRPGHLVRTHLGRSRVVQRISERRITEDLIQITCGDQVVEVTPEHPFLTSRGWVCAGLLETGDYLFRDPHLSAFGEDSEDAPAEFTQQDLLEHVLGALARAVVPRWVNFKSDSLLWQGQVDVDSHHSKLWDEFKAFLEQEVSNCGFVDRRLSVALSGLRALDLLYQRPRLSAYDDMSRLRNAFALLRCATLADDDALLTDRTNGDTTLHDALGDGASSCTEAFRETLDALAVLVTARDLIDVEKYSFHRDVHYHGAAVTSISKVPFEGVVHNFSVEEDESYVIEGGFVVHNCGCQVVHLPEGFGFEKKPPEGEGWKKIPGKKGGWRKPKKSLSRARLAPGEEEKPEWEYWSPQLVPDTTRKGLAFERDLMKSFMSYGDSVPLKGCSVHIADGEVRREAEKVLAITPPQLFDKEVGVTLLTTDIPRPQVALTSHDLAYWTGNEIRLSQTLPAGKVAKVLKHELGHALNVYLIRKMGSVAAVRGWHDGLFEIGKREGYVSKYASTLPIESAAEVTRLYLFNRNRLIAKYPRQFAFVHKAYKELRL